MNPKTELSTAAVSCGASLAAFAALAMLAGAAHAQEAQPPLAVVQFRGASLTKPAEVKRLYARLKDAALDVCDAGYNTMAMRTALTRSACYKDALAKAVANVRSPALTVVYEAENPEPKAFTQAVSR